MTAHFFQARYADGAVPVAWVTSGFPVELLPAARLPRRLPGEPRGDVRRRSGSCPSSPTRRRPQGYSRDLCSYARDRPRQRAHRPTRRSGACPRPTCSPAAPTSARPSSTGTRRWPITSTCPLVLVDTPFVYGEGRAAPPSVRARPARGARSGGRSGSPGRRGRPERARRGGRKACRRGRDALGRVPRHREGRPAPWTGFDGFFHMAPIVALRGTEACNDYYRAPTRRAARPGALAASAASREERHRLLWDNLRDLVRGARARDAARRRGFNFVVHELHERLGRGRRAHRPRRPDRLGGRPATRHHPEPDLRNRLGILRRLVPRLLGGRRRAPQRPLVQALLDRAGRPQGRGWQRELGVRVLLLEADHSDPRAWSAGAGREPRSRAFMEGFA